MRNAHPGAGLSELAQIMANRLRPTADGGHATAHALLEAEVHGGTLELARILLALQGARWVPAVAEVPQQERRDEIASTVLELTGWESVVDETVQAIYRWLFGDEAAFVAGAEMRVEAGLRMLDSDDPRPVHVPHPDTGELVLVTLEESSSMRRPTAGCRRPRSGTRRGGLSGTSA